MDRRKIIRWGVRIILILGILAIVNFFHVAGWEIRSGFRDFRRFHRYRHPLPPIWNRKTGRPSR